MPHMEPEQLIKAANELFQIENDIYAPSAPLSSSMSATGSALTSGGLSMGAALTGSTEAWLEQRMTPTRDLVTNLAEFLTAHSQEMVDVDEFNGTEFDEYSNLVQRPRPNSNVT